MNDMPLNEAIGEDKDGNSISLMDVLGTDKEGVEAKVEQKLSMERIMESYSDRLTAREKVVLELRYGLSGKEILPQRTVAQKLGISRSYVSRIEKRALKKLRQVLEEKTLYTDRRQWYDKTQKQEDASVKTEYFFRAGCNSRPVVRPQGAVHERKLNWCDSNTDSTVWMKEDMRVCPVLLCRAFSYLS